LTLLSDLLDYPFHCQYETEKLLSLDDLRAIDIDHTKSQIGSKSRHFCYVRESLYAMLEEAAKLLPSKYRFLLKEGYRPASYQRREYASVREKYKEKYTRYSDQEIASLVSQYVAPIEVAGHPTGGAIDVTLTEDGKELFLGTDYNDEPESTGNRTYSFSPDITKGEKSLRAILFEPLRSAGFINYPTEWWHWSFGDKYWAHQCGKPVRYELIEDDAVAGLTDIQ